ncbi:hypothetical protein CKA32_000619 [Geitlerinema sp. FC II]|nr:hypothetical protein CKA32_000619 [Geitlerinema sp. FC II]
MLRSQTLKKFDGLKPRYLANIGVLDNFNSGKSLDRSLDAVM